MSHRSPSPRRLLGRALFVVIALASLSACTEGRQVPDEYGETTESNFQVGCVESMTGEGEGTVASRTDATDICKCSYKAITEEIPFEEFKEIMDAQEEEPAELPDEIKTIVDGCVDAQGEPTS